MHFIATLHYARHSFYITGISRKGTLPNAYMNRKLIDTIKTNEPKNIQVLSFSMEGPGMNRV